MLLLNLSFLFSLVAYVSADADAEPAQSIYTRNDDPSWSRFECDIDNVCPSIVRRKRKGYSEICIVSSENWYKLTRKSFSSNLNQAHAKSLAIKQSLAPIMVEMYERNKKRLVEYKENVRNIANIAHITLDKSKGEYLINGYFMIPKLTEGEFQIPCTALLKDNGVLGKYLSLIRCHQIFQSFTRVESVPKCFYAVQKSSVEDKEKLRQQVGWDENEFVVTGLQSAELKGHEWYIAPDNLYKENDD